MCPKCAYPKLKLAWDFLFLARLFATLRVKFLNYLEGNLSGLGGFEQHLENSSGQGYRLKNIGQSEKFLEARNKTRQTC